MADIINPAYLSMPAQVQKNKDDIEALRNSAFVATPEGQYSATTTYGKGALVAYTDGNIYYHFSDTETQGVPPSDTNTWVEYQIGVPGPKGEPGDTGEKGEPGTDGVTPNISATATISNTTGTPSVQVTKSGTGAAPSFDFAFQNLKGEKGNQGQTGENGADGQGFNYMGAWVSENEYHEYDVVTYNGSSYVNILAISGSATPPSSDATHWNIFAERGAQGPSGSPLYKHNVRITGSYVMIYLTLYLSTSTPITSATLLQYIPASEESSQNISGFYNPGGTVVNPVFGISYNSGAQEYMIEFSQNDSPPTDNLFCAESAISLSDKVTQIL